MFSKGDYKSELLSIYSLTFFSKCVYFNHISYLLISQKLVTKFSLTLEIKNIWN